MKFLNYLFVVAFTLFTCCACADNNEMPEGPAEPEGPDYLFMFYGMGGGNLDHSIISNLFQALDAGNDDKVKMTFQYKMSARMQEEYTGFNGTRRLTGEDNAHLKGQFKSLSEVYPMVQESKYKEFFDALKSEKIGSAGYDMACADSLTAFIKWSKDKYPTAKRTILVLAGHGKGWNLKEDGMKDNAETRGVLSDDNNRNLMTQNAVVTGVKNAGNVDLIYCDACLMGMYETLYAYAGCAKYCLASMEATPELGGQYINFINLLKEAGSSDEGLEKAMQKHCDYCEDEWWPKSTYSDIGFYNLTKLNTFTPVLKNVVDMLVEKFTSEESIKPAQTETLPNGDRFGKYISNAFMNCEIVDVKPVISTQIFSEAFIELMKKEQVNYFDSQEVLHWVGSKYGTKEIEDLMSDMEIIVTEMNKGSVNSFSLTDLLRILDNSLVEVGAGNNPFGSLRTELLSALKDLAYIRCSVPKTHTGIDEAYELCSPGIMIVPMSMKLYEDPLNSEANFDIIYVDDALKAYQSTAFDQEIGWSRMLKLIDVIPSLLTNPIRSEVK